jgi:hypothetical protein
MTELVPSELAFLAVVLAVTGVAGWFCVFRTSTLVSWAQSNYRNSKIARWWPGSGLVLKSWYPTYLRCMGIYAWAFGLFILAMFIFSK